MGEVEGASSMGEVEGALKLKLSQLLGSGRGSS